MRCIYTCIWYIHVRMIYACDIYTCDICMYSSHFWDLWCVIRQCKSVIYVYVVYVVWYFLAKAVIFTNLYQQYKNIRVQSEQTLYYWLLNFSIFDTYRKPLKLTMDSSKMETGLVQYANLGGKLFYMLKLLRMCRKKTFNRKYNLKNIIKYKKYI